MNENRSTFTNIIYGFFSLFNTLRKIIVNLVFFTVLFFIVVAIYSSDEQDINIPEGAALVLDLRGDIVEQKFEVDPFDSLMSEALDRPQQAPEILLSEVVDVIEHASTDPKIQYMVLDLKNLRRAGITKLRDIAQALEQFKAHDKQIIAVGEHFNQDQYYLASHANDVWLNPKGWLLLDGYGRYQLYFKSALDKLAISQHIFRVGTYKSAVEPYMRDNMSDAAKEANEQWLNDLWQQYKQDVAKQRGFGVDNFDENIDSLVAKLKAADGNIADYALQNQWVDHLKTQEQSKQDLIALIGENNSKRGYKHVNFKDYLTTITPPLPLLPSLGDKVAVVVAKGTILDGNQKPGLIGGKSTAELLRKARENDDVKAVVLRVDSPGGSAYASEVIRQQVELLKQAGKPVIASMGTYAASGGYWISAPADKIYAAPTTITGSIGIFGFFMTFENTLSKLGIHTDGVGTTDIAGFGPTRAVTPGMADFVQLNIERGYRDFIQLVAQNRNMTTAQVDAIAQGRVWSGKTAQQLGLVDELGNLDDAIAAAANLAELENYDVLLVEKEKSPKAQLIQDLFGQANSWLGLTPTEQPKPTDLAALIQLLQHELAQLAQLNDPQGIYSFCMACNLD